MQIKYLIPKIILILSVFVFYFIFTLSYYKKLSQSVLFSKRIKLFHKVAIWIIPFIWILILIGVTNRTPGSFEIIDKKHDEPWSDPYTGP